ncbi:nuclear transport factor 2 family protein [Psychromonas aquatilis]|uniref:Nuclear transport factor 2 family protein n=1 Tax=Psychromonas aquatilis TaxID=2005072 RepID=A0ABU9GRB7_9GAMM
MSQQHTLNQPNTSQLPDWLANFIRVYEKLGTDNLSLLNSIYDSDIHFQDPMHELQGIDALGKYFDSLYTNLSYCHFKIDNVIHDDQQAALYWTMAYQHNKLNHGKEVIIEGSSKLISNGEKVISHRDYLDLGAMLYEQIPVIGKLITCIKARASK